MISLNVAASTLLSITQSRAWRYIELKVNGVDAESVNEFDSQEISLLLITHTRAS